MMKGKLAFDFGAQPKAEGELAASWVDVDALLAAGAPANTPADMSAAGVLSAIAERALKEAATVGDGTLTVNLEQASIGGDLVGGIDLVVAAKDGAVTIERLQADLPGSNRIEASGRLAKSERGPVFEGPVTLDGSKLKTLVRWAAGARDMSGQATAGAFTFSAKTVIGGGDLKLEDASGELSGTKFSGALHYRGGEHRVVDLTLDSDRLDLREVLGESAAWQSWLPDPAAAQGTAPASDQSLLGALRDDEVHATLRVGELLLPNIPPGRLDAKFSLAKDNLDVERLDFAAPGAIALNGNGSIARLSTAPAGQADLSIQALTADGLKVDDRASRPRRGRHQIEAASELGASRPACRPHRDAGWRRHQRLDRGEGQGGRLRCRHPRQGCRRSCEPRRCLDRYRRQRGRRAAAGAARPADAWSCV